MTVLGIALLGARAAGWAIRQSVPWNRSAGPTPDEVTRFERELAPARALLAGHRTIGYAFAGSNQMLLSVAYAEQTHRFVLAQYTFAPALVSRRSGLPWVFADFPTPEALHEFAGRNGYTVRWSRRGQGVLQLSP